MIYRVQNALHSITKGLQLKQRKGEHMTIKELRVKKRLTQDEFAQVVGVHKRTVSAWERGIIVPSAKKLRIIEDKFKAKLSY